MARVGNSGQTGVPHLHFHVMDRPSVMVADGMPYVFDTFEMEGRTPSLDEVVALGEAGEPIPVDPATAGPRQDQLPLGRDVVGFGDAPEE